MEKTEMMKEFEDKTELNATILTVDCGVMPRIYYSNWLESELLNAKEHVQNLEFLLNQKNENILQLEAKANISDEAIEAFQKIIRNQCDEISALKEKAESYGRIMSGGRKTLKEWANIFGMPVAVDKNFGGIVFDEMPELLRTVEAWRAQHGYVGLIPSLLIDFTGSWQDSLTLPDGWETKGENK
jgi:hypothetical protein